MSPACYKPSFQDTHTQNVSLQTKSFQPQLTFSSTTHQKALSLFLCGDIPSLLKELTQMTLEELPFWLCMCGGVCMGNDAWESVCQLFCQKLIAGEKIVDAATALVALGKTFEALQVFF